MPQPLPRHLQKLSKAELESLCVDCGICCTSAIPVGKSSVFVPELRCKHLSYKDGESQCGVYNVRHDVAKNWCLPIADAIAKNVLPNACPYVQGMSNYEGPIALSESAYDMIRPQVKDKLIKGMKPEWASDSHWAKFLAE
jgi:uncharacterized cysteine cluster protein YcgN (CxxCxxCC family)